MRLTNIEIYKYAQEKYDKANNPHVTLKNFVYFYEEARNEWFALADKDFELTEKRRHDFRNFVKKTSFTGDIYTLPESILYIKAVYTDFSSDCLDEVYKIPVRPLGWDEINVTLRNPFTCPSDDNPAYVEYDGKLEIYSTTAPTNTTVVYIKRPEPYNPIANPDGFTEENREQQEAIIDIAVSKIKLKFSQSFGYQAMKSSEIPMNE